MAAEAWIPGVAAFNAARTLLDKDATPFEKGLAAVQLVTSVVPPLSAGIKAIGGVIKTERAVARIAKTDGLLALGATEVAKVAKGPLKPLVIGENMAERVEPFAKKIGGEVNQVFHATTSPEAAQHVLNGINPKYLNANSRFGKAFYVAEKPDVALAELSHHGLTPTHGIRYSVDSQKLRVLDLTDPSVAAKYGYKGGKNSPNTQALGPRAIQDGYNAIRFASERGDGNNLAVLKDFNEVLKPEMISPISP
jgi:hypothetical protein